MYSQVIGIKISGIVTLTPFLTEAWWKKYCALWCIKLNTYVHSIDIRSHGCVWVCIVFGVINIKITSRNLCTIEYTSSKIYTGDLKTGYVLLPVGLADTLQNVWARTYSVCQQFNVPAYMILHHVNLWCYTTRGKLMLVHVVLLYMEACYNRNCKKKNVTPIIELSLCGVPITFSCIAAVFHNLTINNGYWFIRCNDDKTIKYWYSKNYQTKFVWNVTTQANPICRMG